MKAARFDDLDNLAYLGRLDRPRQRAVHLERPMTPPGMVMRQVVRQDAPKVPLAKDDDVREALATDAADHPLDVWRLPW